MSIYVFNIFLTSFLTYIQLLLTRYTHLWLLGVWIVFRLGGDAWWGLLAEFLPIVLVCYTLALVLPSVRMDRMHRTHLTPPQYRGLSWRRGFKHQCREIFFKKYSWVYSQLNYLVAGIFTHRNQFSAFFPRFVLPRIFYSSHARKSGYARKKKNLRCHG